IFPLLLIIRRRGRKGLPCNFHKCDPSNRRLLRLRKETFCRTAITTACAPGTDLHPRQDFGCVGSAHTKPASRCRNLREAYAAGFSLGTKFPSVASTTQSLRSRRRGSARESGAW